MAFTTTSYDPTSTAQALAESYTAGRQSILDTQTTAATATEKGLSTLSSALSTYQTSLQAMTGLNQTMSASSAVFSDTSVATASAKSDAAAGSYGFFVKQLATANQISYSSLGNYGGDATTLSFGDAGAPAFSVDVSKGMSVRDLATAINSATGNTTVRASVVTTSEGKSELVLSATATGYDNRVKLNATGELSTWLGTANQLSAGLDAIVQVGAEGGTEIKQASNTFNVIDGVSFTVNQAQSSGSKPLTLTVASDTSKTLANAQAFVDAYNKLKTAIDALVKPGSESTAAGVFAGDSGVLALRDRLVSSLRDNSGGASLATFGITAARDGSLTLDSARLTKALAKDPTGLDTLIGSTSTSKPSGIASKLDTYLKLWTNATNGQLGSRKTAIGKLQIDLVDRQTAIDKQYDSAYERYLAQFTKLQTVQSTMTYNVSLFDALFSDDD